MRPSPLSDAFAHHIWATDRLFDVCLALEPDRLAEMVPGTYGSIDRTLRHLVGSDGWYLFTIDGDRSHIADEDRAELRDLRSATARNGDAWQRLISDDLDPDRMVVEVDDEDGYTTSAAMGVRLAQALHHGTDHRSQVCTSLTVLGIEPPSIDVWDYALASGRMVVNEPPASPTD